MVKWLALLSLLATLLSGCIDIRPAPAEMASLQVAPTQTPTAAALAAAPATSTPRPAAPTMRPAPTYTYYWPTTTPTSEPTTTPTATPTSEPTVTITPEPVESSPSPVVMAAVAPLRAAPVQVANPAPVSVYQPAPREVKAGGGGGGAEEETPTPTEEPTETPTPAPPEATGTPLPTCSGDEAMTFGATNPLVGTPITVTVSSSKPHTGVRLTGPVGATFLGAGTAGNRTTWTWRVTPTEEGTFNFSFFIADSLLCTTNSFVALSPTPTPTPTPSPTPTPVAVPHIDRILPSHGITGTVVTIQGKNFGDSRGNAVLLYNRQNLSSDILQWGDYFIVLNGLPPYAPGHYELQVVVRGMRSNVVTWKQD